MCSSSITPKVRTTLTGVMKLTNSSMPIWMKPWFSCYYVEKYEDDQKKILFEFCHLKNHVCFHKSLSIISYFRMFDSFTGYRNIIEFNNLGVSHSFHNLWFFTFHFINWLNFDLTKCFHKHSPQRSLKACILIESFLNVPNILYDY